MHNYYYFIERSIQTSSTMIMVLFISSIFNAVVTSYYVEIWLSRPRTEFIIHFKCFLVPIPVNDIDLTKYSSFSQYHPRRHLTYIEAMLYSWKLDFKIENVDLESGNILSYLKAWTWGTVEFLTLKVTDILFAES